MVVADHRDALQPQLAEAVPSVENGRWSLFSDGRMRTTWTIRQTAAWHDDTPFTAEDLIFTARVVQDRELIVFRNRGMESVESLDATDPRTIVVDWRRPFIYADAMFARRFAFPMPKHLLERPYLEDKASFTQHPFWAEEYVGTGAFQLREFVRDSHLLLAANDRYVLGRPRIDEIEVKFIVDSAGPFPQLPGTTSREQLRRG